MTWALYEYDELPPELAEQARAQESRALLHAEVRIEVAGNKRLMLELPLDSSLRSGSVDLSRIAAAITRELKQATRLLIADAGELPRSHDVERMGAMLLFRIALYSLEAGQAEVSVETGDLGSLRRDLTRGVSLLAVVDSINHELGAAMTTERVSVALSEALSR